MATWKSNGKDGQSRYECDSIRNCSPLKIHDDLYALYAGCGGRACCARGLSLDAQSYINYIDRPIGSAVLIDAHACTRQSISRDILFRVFFTTFYR